MTIGTPIFYPAGPIAIRDGTVTAIQTVSGLLNVYKARTIPTKDSALPFAAVWLAGDRTEPNGDSNVGSPEFLHKVSIVVDVMTAAGNEAALDTKIVQLVETIRATLLTSPTWLALVEGVERADTRYAYPKETNDILVQAIIEIDVTIRSQWPPYAPNDLLQVMVSTSAGLTTEIDLPGTTP